VTLAQRVPCKRITPTSSDRDDRRLEVNASDGVGR
jgi:hypothetical protein